MDALSAFFLVLVCVVGTVAAFYAREYWSDEQYAGAATRGRAWWSAFVLTMGLVLTASNGLHFLIAWEAFAVCGYFLITLERQRSDVRSAGWLYLAASHTGTLALFAFFSAIAAKTGSWDLGPLQGQPGLAPLFWLAFLGFGLKAGFFPLHVWLPSAHANAPSHVSAIMSGVAIKMGIYGIIRFGGWLPVPESAGSALMVVGATSALIGIVLGFVQNDAKRLLAYSSVENVGVIVAGLGAALYAGSRGDAVWGRIALAGALLHVWNHGAFKSLLFLGAGSVLHATETREMSRLGGLWRLMPWTAGTFAVGALAVSALPPLNGFVSEWLIYVGLIEGVTSAAPPWAAAVAVVVLATAGAVTVATFVKAGSLIFLGAPRTRAAARAHEAGPWMRASMAAMSSACIGMGLLPALLWPAIGRAAGAWNLAWTTTAPPEGLRTLGAAQVALVAVAMGVAALLWRKTHGNGVRREVTWDCGYALPTRRMQYSSGSFSGIVSGWFRWVLRPVRAMRRPRGVYPSGALRLERIPDAVLDGIARPVGGLVEQLSTASRRLQHGGLQLYILYVLGALTAVATLVVAGGRP